MIKIITSPLFYIMLTLGLYYLFDYNYKKYKKIYFHPLVLTSSILIIYIYLISLITSNNTTNVLEGYNSSLSIVNIMLGPLTVSLALPIYNNWKVFKENWLTIIIGTIVGCITSILSTILLANVFQLDNDVIKSLLPKSVTTAIAKEISININAIPEITIASVIVTGLLGSLFGPMLSKRFRFDNYIINGMAFGSSSHAIGTSKAMELSKEAGAISSIAIVTSGILTMIITLFIK